MPAFSMPIGHGSLSSAHASANGADEPRQVTPGRNTSNASPSALRCPRRSRGHTRLVAIAADCVVNGRLSRKRNPRHRRRGQHEQRRAGQCHVEDGIALRVERPELQRDDWIRHGGSAAVLRARRGHDTSRGAVADVRDAGILPEVFQTTAAHRRRAVSRLDEADAAGGEQSTQFESSPAVIAGADSDAPPPLEQSRRRRGRRILMQDPEWRVGLEASPRPAGT